MPRNLKDIVRSGIQLQDSFEVKGTGSQIFGQNLAVLVVKVPLLVYEC
jgi:hypothetical protein